MFFSVLRKLHLFSRYKVDNKSHDRVLNDYKMSILLSYFKKVAIGTKYTYFLNSEASVIVNHTHLKCISEKSAMYIANDEDLKLVAIKMIIEIELIDT